MGLLQLQHIYCIYHIVVTDIKKYINQSLFKEIKILRDLFGIQRKDLPMNTLQRYV